MILGTLTIDGDETIKYFNSVLSILFEKCNIQINLEEGPTAARRQFIVEFFPSDGESKSQSMKIIKQLVSGVNTRKLDGCAKEAFKKLCTRNACLTIKGNDLPFISPTNKLQTIETQEGHHREGMLALTNLGEFTITLRGSTTPIVFSKVLWPDLSQVLGQIRISVEGTLHTTINGKESLEIDEQETLRMLKTIHDIISEAIDVVEDILSEHSS